ncbi:hypothetical protein RB195_015004 [Necator americanus]|uniref:Uncharacterized protein n=1 Tax=Necator americanus TaxID=51031 RepID=A0ABR1E320_NECAM
MMLLAQRAEAKNGQTTWKDLLRIDKMDDRWVHDKPNATYISRRNLLSTDDECPVIHLSYVAPSALGLV